MPSLTYKCAQHPKFYITFGFEARRWRTLLKPFQAAGVEALWTSLKLLYNP